MIQYLESGEVPRMKKESLLKKQLLQNMMYTFVVFAIIALFFGAITYNQIRNSIFSDVENELIRYAEMEQDVSIKDTIDDPRIIIIIRDLNGEILNADGMGRVYDRYLHDLEFDNSKIGEVYELKVRERFNFRGITYEYLNGHGETAYAQLLINVDSKINLLNNLLRILLLGGFFISLFTIVASYVLSKRSLLPVVEAWKKQVEFTQNASHELRTPLAVMQLKQEKLLLDPSATIQEKSEDIKITLEEIERLTKLTTGLMALARGEGNVDQIRKEETNIDEVIREVVKPYEELAKEREKKITLNLKTEKNIMVDKYKVQQLMIILLDNAIKYTKKGDSIEIGTRIEDKSCIIEVKDTGIGITTQARKYIFDRFYREDKAESKKCGGTGLRVSHCVLDCSSTWRSYKSLRKQAERYSSIC